jgi:hypothetical protein
MALSGHGEALQERRFNHGLQTLPSGRSAFPVPRTDPYHRSLLQGLPELWSDFSDQGLPEARAGLSEGAATYHGDYDAGLGLHLSKPSLRSASRPGAAASPGGTISPVLAPGEQEQLQRKPGHAAGRVVFVGYATFDMDGRAHTAGEMDRLMMRAANSKYPCARPATFDEYADGAIMNLPQRNKSGLDVAFVGPGATGSELFHTNTLGMQKCCVAPGDDFSERQWGVASLHGRKALLCVYPAERLRRQRSLTQYGLARDFVTNKSGPLRKAGSLACLSGSSPQSQSTTRDKVY